MLFGLFIRWTHYSIFYCKIFMQLNVVGGKKIQFTIEGQSNFETRSSVNWPTRRNQANSGHTHTFESGGATHPNFLLVHL